MKELYIAPEVEILCFMAVETLADNSFWNTYGGARSGDGQVDSFVEIPGEGNPDDGEEV